jgi:hypothetical protein
MKRIALPLIMGLLALALPLAAETWKGVALLDASCAGKKDVMAHPETHSKSCALQCSKAGYGAMIDGKFVKFDAKGNELTSAALKKTEAKDHLRANIAGEMKGGTLYVSSLTID